MAVIGNRQTSSMFDNDPLAAYLETQEEQEQQNNRRPASVIRPFERALALGKHVTMECYDCDEHILNDVDLLEQACQRVVRDSGATMVSSHFKRFDPQGISGVIIISESHFTIHSWPEHQYAAVDQFTCGSSVDMSRAVESLKREFGTDGVMVSADMTRGILGNNGIERHVPVCENSNHVFTLSWKERFEETQAWGLLSSIDVHHCDPEKIRSADHIRWYVRELCERIEMKRFQDTVVVNFGEDERVAGFSMTQLIETSLISGHFANQSNRAYIDIFSCKYYEPREAAEFTLEAFGGQHYQMQVALRS